MLVKLGAHLVALLVPFSVLVLGYSLEFPLFLTLGVFGLSLALAVLMPMRVFYRGRSPVFSAKNRAAELGEVEEKILSAYRESEKTKKMPLEQVEVEEVVFFPRDLSPEYPEAKKQHPIAPLPASVVSVSVYEEKTPAEKPEKEALEKKPQVSGKSAKKPAKNKPKVKPPEEKKGKKLEAFFDEMLASSEELEKSLSGDN